MTRQQNAILTAMRKHPGHYTADEIFSLAREEYPAISRATVYNSLLKFAAEGKIRKLPKDGNTAVYDTVPVLHAHVLCPVCGKYRDVRADAVVRAIEEQFGADVPFGLVIDIPCESCKNNEKCK